MTTNERENNRQREHSTQPLKHCLHNFVPSNVRPKYEDGCRQLPQVCDPRIAEYGLSLFEMELGGIHTIAFCIVKTQKAA
ncbi:hypothetical protein ACFXG4_41090 [Nocardia sp. NPDC059246]|uniref:hypothetical protein n=1 Tax=Nocardia sp. NPDC059246 TaxID=3346789 RepID=UPI0036B38FE3